MAPFGVGVVVVEPGAVRTEMPGRAIATAHELASAMTPEQSQRYGALVHAITAQTASHTTSGSGLPADSAAKVIAKAITWGAPRIHGELQMLGLDISERTVLRWMRKAPRNPEPATRWAAFLSNHREVIASMDFFTVPTLTLGVLYCFFVIAHDRRRILQCRVTRHPTSTWVIQQLRETFPYDSAPLHLIFDRGPQFNEEVVDTLKSFGIQPKRTSFRSPWQNGVAERWVGNCRRDVLDHVIVLNERHLKRLMNEYVRYYHEDRTHLALDKQTPAGREMTSAKNAAVRVISTPRLGGLHHRYDLAA